MKYKKSKRGMSTEQDEDADDYYDEENGDYSYEYYYMNNYDDDWDY